MEKIVLAADLGGTNLRMAAVGLDGSIVFRNRISTPSSGQRNEIIDAIASMIDECREALGDGYELTAFGATVPATVGSPDGVILRSPNLPDLNGFRFEESFAERLSIPVLLENDANAAAVGEKWMGASRGVENSICVTLGTGVGGGIILDGNLYRGVDGSAGEIGHIAVEPDGHPCGCGSKGCVEQYSSATAIVRIAKELISEYPGTPLSNFEEFTPLEVYNAGLAGDALSLEVFRRVGRYLGIALGGLVNVIVPEAIVIGGGVAAGWDLFIEPLSNETVFRASQQPAERVKLVRSLLGDDAGILGAAHLAIESSRSKASIGR